MTHFDDFYLKLFKQRGTILIIDETTNNQPLEDLKRKLLDNNTTSIIVDSHSLYSKKELKQLLSHLPSGILFVDNFPEIPEGDDRDSIISLLRVCFKRDYYYCDENTIFTEEWIEHLSKTPITIVVFIRKENLSNIIVHQFRTIWTNTLLLTNNGLTV